MPNQAIETRNSSSAPDLQTAALQRLRLGVNPFATQVATVGTIDESLHGDVSEFTATQRSQLLEIIQRHREGHPATRVYPVLGDRGSGKTHLLYSLREALRELALTSGEETIFILAERVAPDMDLVDYLLWPMVNFLLAQKGEGKRLLGVVAARLTGRLLAEALRHLPPHQRLDLIPAKGLWDWIRLRLGSTSVVQGRLAGIEKLIQTCDRKNPTPQELRDVCDEAKLPLLAAVDLIEEHLQTTESSDVPGWFRKCLYGALARFTLLQDQEPFEELHESNYEEAPAVVRSLGNPDRGLLEAWIELLTALKIPSVLVFDQLEDHLSPPDPEQEKRLGRYFRGLEARFINEQKHVCILIFAEQGFWWNLNYSQTEDTFTSDRLRQPLPLSGLPAEISIKMPDKVPLDVLVRLIQHRLRDGFPELDLTGLPPTFPFDEAFLKQLQVETTIRACLRRLAHRYGEIVHPPLLNLRKKLEDLWTESVTASAKKYGSDPPRVASIPEVQNALLGWLECLQRNGLTGSVPWDKVEMVTDPEKQQYGSLCVIRTAGPHAPGIGVAAWFGTRRAQAIDLKQRVAFFKARPCPIVTLVMLRADGEDALNGDTEAVYNTAIRGRRDLRIQQYEPRHLHAIMAFSPWLQAALTEVATAKESDPHAEPIFRYFLASLSKELLQWVETWRQPVQKEEPE